MASEKYINYYIDTLVSTLTDCVVRNVSLQANAKVTDEVIQDQQKKNAGLEKQLEELKLSIDDLQKVKTDTENSTIQSLQLQLQQKSEELNRLNVEVNSVTNIRRELETAKGQLVHIDNFRNEVVKARNEIKSLTDKYESEIKSLTDKYESQIKELDGKIESLQKSLKKKKQKETNQSVEVRVEEVENQLPQTTVSELDTVKDGGSF